MQHRTTSEPPKQEKHEVRNEALEELKLSNELLNSIHSWVTFAIVVYLINMVARVLIFLSEHAGR